MGYRDLRTIATFVECAIRVLDGCETDNILKLIP